MYAARRKLLAAIIEELEDLQSRVEDLALEERDAFDNLPEGLQESEWGEAINDAADSLDSMQSSIESALVEAEAVV